MFDHGRRRCCTGVYMLDAENFQSIVAELRSEESCLKMRSRGPGNASVGHISSHGNNSQNDKRVNASNNVAPNSCRRSHGSNDSTECESKQTTPKGEKGHYSSSRKGHSFFGGTSTPKSTHSHGEDKSKSNGTQPRNNNHQNGEDSKHKTRSDVLNNKKGCTHTKDVQQHVSSVNTISTSGTWKVIQDTGDVSTEPPVRWIKNNLANSLNTDDQKLSECPKEPVTSVPVISKLSVAPKFSTASIGLPCTTALVHPTLLCPQTNDSIHSLIHYTTGKPILLYDYSEDTCPVCCSSQLKHPICGQPPGHGDSSQFHLQSTIAHPLSQPQQLPKPPPHAITSSPFISSVMPSDFIDITSKTCSHPHVNLNGKTSHFDVKPSIGVNPEASAAFRKDETSHHSHHPCIANTRTSPAGSCCICSETRCSQCIWSQFFYDSYYRVYYMYPQQNSQLPMIDSVYVDLTNKNFTLTIERPHLDEGEARSLTDSSKSGHSPVPVDKCYKNSCSDVFSYDDKGRSTVWSASPRVEQNQLIQLPSSFPSGPLVCISLPNMKSRCSFPFTKTSLVPPLSFVDYYGSTPPDRTWRPLNEPVNGAIQFTLMCYNILCEKYASQQVYPYCPSWALSWLFRRTAIMDEIRLYTADIICLQEVEMDQYEAHFEKILKSQGYSGIFSPKSRAHHMTDAERRKVDGCAIFWKNERFQLVKDTVIEFSRMAMERYENDCKESPEMLNRVMVRDNIALSAILQTKESSYPQQFMVSTAHIHWDPEYSDVKLIQSIMHVSSLYQKIEEHLLEQNGGNGPVYPANMPLIVCGDFNSLPQSGVVEFLTQGKVAKSHPDFKNLGYVKVLDKLCGRRRHGRGPVDHDVLQHDFVLGRAYDSGEGMKYTNYTYDFKGIIDYIFYTKNHFNLLGNLEMVSEGWLKKEKVPGCPHPHIPSDHFPLLVELELQLPNERSGDHHGLMSRK